LKQENEALQPTIRKGDYQQSARDESQGLKTGIMGEEQFVGFIEFIGFVGGENRGVRNKGCKAGNGNP